MANANPFNASSIGTGLGTVYTCPGGKSAWVHNLMLCNKSGADVTVDVRYTKAATGVSSYLVQGLALESKTSVAILGDNNKQCMNENDTIQCLASAGASVDVTGAALEEAV